MAVQKGDIQHACTCTHCSCWLFHLYISDGCLCDNVNSHRTNICERVRCTVYCIERELSMRFGTELRLHADCDLMMKKAGRI